MTTDLTYKVKLVKNVQSNGHKNSRWFGERMNEYRGKFSKVIESIYENTK